MTERGRTAARRGEGAAPLTFQFPSRRWEAKELERKKSIDIKSAEGERTAIQYKHSDGISPGSTFD